MDESITTKIFILWSRDSGENSLFEEYLLHSGWQIRYLTDINLLIPYFVPDSTKIICLCLLGPNKCEFSAEDMLIFYKFYEAGNSLFIASSCYEFSGDQTNLNILTSKFGIAFNKDCVIRPNAYEHYHPKEARLSDFIVNKGLIYSLKKFTKVQASGQSESKKQEDRGNSELQTNEPGILYTKGCTLSVGHKSTIVMTSSDWALPVNQAICAFHKHEARGRVVAIGSSSMFSNCYIDKEDNRAVLGVLLDFIVDKKFSINLSDAKTIEIPQVVPTPDIDRLIDIPISCLKATEPLPTRQNITSLIDRRLFNIDNSLLPSVIRAFREFGVQHVPLNLIKPTFEVKPLQFKLATHNFIIRRS